MEIIAEDKRPFGAIRLKPWQAYGFALLVTVVTLGLRLVFDGPLAGRPTLVIFTMPIMLSAFVGGLGAGLLATTASCLTASYYLFPPLNSFAVASTAERWQLLFLVLAGALISGLNEALHRARRRASVTIREHRETEQERERFFALSQDLLCVLGFDGYFKDLNSAWVETLGYTKAELLATKFIEFVHPADREATLAEAEKVSGGKALTSFENRYLCKDGSHRCFQWNVTPVVADRVMYGVARDITERKRVEATAAELAAIVEFSDDAIIGKNLQGLITSWNLGAEKTFGYAAHEMTGQPITRLIPPERQQEVAEILDRIKRGENVPHFETVRIRKDGSPVRVSITVSAIKDSAGNVVGASKVARDITERLLVEKARLSSEARYRTLFDYAPDGIVIANSQSVYLDANPSLCRMLGYSRDEFIGLCAADIVAQKEIEHVGEAIKEINGKSDHHREWQFRRKNGSLFEAEVIATMMPDGHLLGMIRDITERNRTQEALRQHAALFDQMYDAAIVWTWEGPITFWNRGAERLYGFTRAMALGQTSQELLRTQSPEGCAALNLALMRDGHWEGELEHITQAGRRITVETRMILIREPERTYVLEANRDITERKGAQRRINQLNSELEQRVTERTAQLEAANKELEAFSYSVSHDLRAPLRAVDGYVRMLKEDCADRLDAEGNRLLDVVSGEARRMGQLIDDLLAFSRLGREQMDGATIDMTALARGAFDSSTRTLPEPAPRFDFTALPSARGDLSMLRQVFVNLIGNAVKFTRRQPVPVITVGAISDAGETTYYVKDNGVGFDEQYRHKLFNVFQRLHSEEEFEGTGVGLALVKRIIHRHGGKVWAESKPDQGAAFYFTVPIGKEPANEQSH
jgi:PAS domain S-box-containing protein